MVNITPHVGRHTWANITLEFIYNSLLSESLILAQDYGIRARMNGVLEPAIEQLRALGGWSLTSNIGDMPPFLIMIHTTASRSGIKLHGLHT